LKYEHREPFKIAKISVGKPFYLNEQDFEDEELNTIRSQRKKQTDKLVDLVK
jgi:hypothetical protein